MRQANGNRRFSQRKNLVAGLIFAGLCLSVGGVFANINVESVYRDENGDGWGPAWFFATPFSPRFVLERVNRMGMTTYDGTPFYAVRNQQNGIRVCPAENGDTGTLVPTRDDGRTAFLNIPDAILNVAGLVTRDDLVYLVCYSDQGQKDTIWVQPYKMDPLKRTALKTAGPLMNVVVPDLQCVMVVNGDRGLYVHVMAHEGKDRAKLVTYVVRKGDLHKLSTQDIAQDIVPEQRATCDGVATHEIDPVTGVMEEVQYLVWANNPGRLYIDRYRPAVGDPATTGNGTGHDVSATGETINRLEGSIFTLVEGSMDGDPDPDYSLSLVQFSQSHRYYTYAREHSISVRTHTFSGGWNDFGSIWEADPTPGAAVHWGMDKSIIRANGDIQTPTKNPRTRFASRMRQWYRGGIITFHHVEHPFSTDNHVTFRGINIKGNQYETFVAADAPSGFTTLDTGNGSKGNGADPGLLAAWTLIGVVHGIPPYIPYKITPSRYPNLTFMLTASTEKTTGLTFSTDDSYELSIGGSAGAGGEKDGSGIFSIESSFSSNVKTSASNSSSSTTTISQTTNQTFEPGSNPGSLDPAEIGFLIYSAPTYVSKAYDVRRWDNASFAGETRHSYLTLVDRRSLFYYTYLIDNPDAGPLETMGQGPNGTNPLAALTAGIAPVHPTNELNAWRAAPVDLNKYDVFTVNGDPIEITASRSSTGSFQLSYFQSDSHSQSSATTRTNTETVKVSGGLKGIFSITGTGTWTQSSTFSTTQTVTASFGSAISGVYPTLSDQQPVRLIKVATLLVYANGNAKASWVPTLLQGSDAPFLLTWKINELEPPKFLSKPWKQHGYP